MSLSSFTTETELETGLMKKGEDPVQRAKNGHLHHCSWGSVCCLVAGLLLGDLVSIGLRFGVNSCSMREYTGADMPSKLTPTALLQMPAPIKGGLMMWDPAIDFEPNALFPVAVPEFTDPELMRRAEAVRDGYASEMHLPHTARLKLADAMPQMNSGVAFLKGGKLEKRHGTSTEILFRQESQFLYLSGFDHEEALLVVGLRTIVGVSSDRFSLFSPFVPFRAATTPQFNSVAVFVSLQCFGLGRQSQLKATHMDLQLSAGDGWLFIDQGDPVWGGGWLGTLDECALTYDVDRCFWLSDLAHTMAGLSPAEVYTMPNTELPEGALPPGATQVESGLSVGLSTARVQKTDQELEVMRVAAAIAVEEHKAIMRYVRCGNYESDAESLFRYVAHNYGARHQAYLPIVGSGAASALLHYNENDKMMADGALVLVDAAAELGATRVGGGYASDITRTWPCSGTFSANQRAVHDVVNSAVEAGIANAVEGSSFTVASRAAADAILAGLLELGLLQGATVEELYEARIHSLFMPHSLGHSIGIDVHDGGAINPFAPGMVITIEPGIYFYPTLLTPAFANPSQAPYLNQELLESEYFDFGGIRLEDVVIITAGGGPPENLVSPALARSATDIEALMAEGVAEMEAIGNPSIRQSDSWEERAGRAHAPPNGARFAGDSLI